MQTYRTTTCRQFGHREITLQLASPSLIPDLPRMLVDYFESSVARGTKFLPGQTVRLGWSTLRLCERSDGTIGVQERSLSPTPEWSEAVDRALGDTWYQKEIVASVGLLDEISFPMQDDAFMVADCVSSESTGEPLILTRLPAGDLPEGFSGWTLACAEKHDHGERHVVPLLALAANQPGLVQFLALPHDTLVLVLYREKPDAPEGSLRIEPHVYRDGEELAPRPGSYLAALQA